MLENKKIVLLLALYLLLTTAIFLFQAQSINKGDSLRFFFQDPNIQGRIREETSYDRNGNTVILTRLYHNKVGEASQVFIVNVYRAVDLPFLFSLSDVSIMYDDHGKIPMLFPIELPFFLLACWHLIRHWQNYRKQFFFIPPFIIFSLLVAGLFYPAENTIRLLPLVITIRLIIFIGIYEFIIHSRWLKKLHLSQ